ncbi:MAG: hypothetical protein K8R92_00155 [Planctomycetes bacterium]|nr:hypothetical protein [Planctomycetota bacterium]
MRRTDRALIGRAALAASLLLLSACSKPAPKQEETQEAKPVEVAAAPSETLNEIVKRLGVDKRIRVDDGEKSPENVKQAEAVLVFFDAMVQGNADKIAPLMSKPDQSVLAEMKKSGQWKSATEKISRVNVGWAPGAEAGTLAVLGFFTVGDDFAAQLWSLSAFEEGKPLIMTALPSPPKIAERLQGNKTDARIKQWLALNKEELASAKAADEIIEIPQQDRSVKGESDSGSGSGEGGPSAPAGPGRRKPDGPPVAPPRGPPLKPG